MKSIVMACILCMGFSVACAQVQNENVQQVPEPVSEIAGLRNMVFELSPGDIEVVPTEELPRVWGVVMEMGFPGALVTLVNLADGTSSLYFGTGGGVIGAGEHQTVRDAATKMINMAEEMHALFDPVQERSLPYVGEIKFYVMTHAGLVGNSASEQALQTGSDDLSRLYKAGQKVLDQIRMIQEKG